MKLIHYPKCTTCQRAKKWLQAQNIPFEERHIAEEAPTQAELQSWYEKSGLPLKRFFNTSGMAYRALGLKDKLPTMTEAEQLALLATDGMLVKRPLLVDTARDIVLVGFREGEWEAALGAGKEAQTT